jgi:hypothetical protein
VVTLRGKEPIKDGGEFLWRCDLSKRNARVKALNNDKMKLEAKLAGNQDIGPAKDTYGSFIALFKWGSVVVAAVVALVVLIIA